jgi:Ca2+-binding RTX toxin-like protein
MGKMADNVRSVRALAPEIALVDEPEFAFNLIAADTIRDASYEVLADLPSAEHAAISGRAGPVFHFVFSFEDWLPIGREHEGPYAVDTIPANTTTTEVLSVPGSRSSTIDTIGDFDFFRVTLEAGFTYTFACNNAGGGGGLTDPSLALYDAAGTLITLDDDSGPGFNALITYTAPTSGVYYLGANGIPTSTGNYVLTAAIVGGPDSIPGDATTTSTLTIDGPAAASAIDLAGDQDWYAITLVAGESYSFSLTGQGGTPLTDAFLSLYSASGQLLSVDDDGGAGLSSLMQYTATASGTYYLSAGGWETTVGGYSVSAAHGPPQDPLDTLDLGFAFGAANISFYFAVTGETHGPTGQALRDWTAAEQASVTSALATISNVANITFTQVATAAEADFIFALTDLETGVLGQTWPDTSIAYMEFAPDGSGWSPAGLQPGGLGYSVVIHEVGHALGLDHPHLDGGDTQVMQGVTDIFDDYGDFLLNQQIFTIMSYNDGWPAEGIFGGTGGGNVSTPMALDIAALQQRYGANLSANAGDTIYDLRPGVGGGNQYICIWDTSGIDTIYAAGFGSIGPGNGAVIDLRPATLLNEVGGGGFVSYERGSNAGFTIAAGVVIENAVGWENNDIFTGNAANNAFTGKGGADVLVGGAGNDVLNGGAGADALDGGEGSDTASYAGSSAAVSINLGAGVASGGEAAGDTLSSIENVSGSAHDDTLGGDIQINQLSGGAGNDTLDGAAGADVLIGGLGDDAYIVDDVGDALTENADEGTDTVRSSLNWTLAASFENLTLTGTATDGLGNALNNIITGNALNNILNGADGNDTIIGGDGADTFAGGLGNDSLLGGIGADAFNWIAGDGRDTISGGADSDTVNLTGSAVADVADANWNGSVITGLLNNALLDIETINMDLGAGGSGGDWLRYNTSFGVTVDLSAGTATGFASVTGVENLIGGTGGDTLVGDGGANKINGNAGDDFITGGAGGDNLTGGLGGDTFVYAAGAGADTVVDFDAWDVGGQDFIDVTAFGIDAGNFASRVTIIDTGADTVVRIDSDVFITLKNVSGDGDNVITMADFILS